MAAMQRILGALFLLSLLLQPGLGYRPAEYTSITTNDDVYIEVAEAGYTAQAKRDRVYSLPGWGDLDDEAFRLFSGYITVDEEAGRALFYIFVQSKHSSEDPLVLWLNGGPGCSSIGGGFLSELGPFYPTPKGKDLQANKYGWHRAANMLFLESPAFVGWSYSNSSQDRVVGDKRTAEDNHEFLLRWLDRFPQFRDNPFYLSGESYAGHYLPTLAREILKGNQAAGSNSRRRINFQGFLVGNALTAPAVDSPGAAEFWWSHGLISDDVFEGAMHNCNWSSLYPLSEYVTADPNAAEEAPPRFRSSKEAACDKFVNKGFEQIAGINIYDIFADVCIRPSQVAPALQLGRMLRDHPAGLATRPLVKGKRSSSSGSGSPKSASDSRAGKYDPCVDDEVTLYLNRPDVQRALHANTTGLPYPWITCTPQINYSRADLLSSMLPVYEELVKSGIRILVYSGDVDAIVPIIDGRFKATEGGSLREWVDWSLSLCTEACGDAEIAVRWVATVEGGLRPLWDPAVVKAAAVYCPVGGWTVDYEGLSFATVRGAGHMVPYTQPERALYLFESFVNELEL
ncbi:hypothetical protein N2152v2_004405 [Parachlorella kessleri]